MNYRQLMIKLSLVLLLGSFMSCTIKAQDEFGQLKASPDWKLRLSDSGTDRWQSNWFLDGQLATIENSERGMNFRAGPVNRDDAHHAVLWTKESFQGDVKIEYEYTRTDSQTINVNILYIQATGVGKESFDQDISQWNDFRKVPTMSKYFNNMNALHISYAAFPTTNDDPDEDYIRVRHYPVSEEKTFSDTEIPPAFYDTGLFVPGETYEITVIKTRSKLFFHVNGENIVKLYSWNLEKTNPITEGRIGLRHMFTRSANYSDFNVWVK